MRTEVAILHHEYSPETRAYAESKLQQLERFFDRTLSVRAMLDRDNIEHRVKLVASIRHGVVEEVEGRSLTFRAALDEAVQRMGRVLARHKEKLVDGHRRRAREHE